MLVQDFLLHSNMRSPEAEVLVTDSGRVSYGQLSLAAHTLAVSLLDRGLKPGERVAALTDVPFDYIVSYVGTLLAGGVFVGLNTQTSARTLGHLLNNCSASVVLTHTKFIRFFDNLANELPCLKSLVLAGGGRLDSFNCCDFVDLIETGKTHNITLPRRSDTDLAQIMYTSGTTGAPKGVMLTHRNLVSNTLSIVQYLGMSEVDRAMVVLPFFYSYGNSVLLSHLAVGGTLVVNQSLLYPNVVLEQMIAEKVTGFPGVPSTFALLLNRSSIQEYDFPSLRYVTQAGGAMSPALARKLASVLTEANIYVMYGQTEAAPRLSYLDPKDLYRKPGSIGKAIPGVVLKVLGTDGKKVEPGETGELVASGENIMAGYWEQPEATAEVLRDGWLWTGDLARIDEEGYLYLVGRKSEMIKSGAHRIAPKEIEEVLLEHIAVYEVAVVGVSDEILGETIKACIVLKPDTVCSERDLILHCRNILPAFKVPHLIQFCDELPKTESGKIKKGELK